ncbi:MAG TPA: ATP-binding protein [Candidatus Sulfotelmatobacter sp.]|nr:ATP-binding protein [Candidatus Sulfotelmatobacter sp.]
MNSSPDWGKSEATEELQSTGQLLRHAFVLVGGLILLGAAIAVWQISVMRQRAQRLYDAEQPALAVLMAHNHFQRFQAELSLVAETHDAPRFTAKAEELRRVFNQDVDNAVHALNGLGPGAERDRQFTGLEAIRTMFSSQMNDLVQLARLGDWRVVELRSQSRDPVVSALSESLVGDIDDLVAEQKRQELDEIERAGDRATVTLLSIGLGTLIIASILGWRVTRSIGGRLQQMDAAVRALARGEFHQRVNVGGSDEIGRLARVFNEMSERVSVLYESLQRSEAQFRSLIENVSDFIVVIQADGSIRYASPSFEREAGEGTSLVGKNLIDLTVDEDRTAVLNLIAAVQLRPMTEDETPAPMEAEFHIQQRDGGVRNLEASATNLLQHPAVNGIVVNARDVTERRKLEEQLMRAQRMEAIGTLSGGVAHDFNNILTVILGHTEVLLQAMKSSPMSGHLKSIEEASRRASALTRQLLAFSRKQVLQPTVFNLNTLIMDLDKMLRRMISEDIELETVADPKLGTVKADPGQIEQVVMNLVVNARDAIRGGGRITIETANLMLDEDYVREHAGARPGPYVVLAVSDTGEGIAPDVLPHIFEPFFTTKEVGRGTGLGLSTVYGIVKQSGGNVWVYSQPGRGSTFKIYLPRVDEPALVVAEPAQPAAESGAETVLLVEDEPALRDLIKIALSGHGFTVLDVGNPGDAITLCKKHTAPLHLLLTDVIMPGMDGPALAKQVRIERPGIKVLYMSGYATNFIMHDGEVDPGTNFLEKPFHPRALLHKVREVLDSGRQGSA